MWIHIPESIQSRSALGTRELASDYEPCYPDLERFCTLKTKSRPARFWRNEWQTSIRLSMLRPSSRTYDPLTLPPGLEEWLSCTAVSLASHTPWLVKRRASTTAVNSQEMSSELPRDLDAQLSFWKTSQELSVSTSTTSDLDYSTWATKLSRDYSQRQKQVRPTEGNDYSYWPTMRATRERGESRTVEMVDGRFIRRSQTSGTTWGASLDGAVQNFPTPVASDSRHSARSTTTDRDPNKTSPPGDTLLDVARQMNFPTPNTFDALPPRSEKGNRKLFEGQRKGRTAPSNLREFVHPEMHPANWRTPSSTETEGGVKDFNQKTGLGGQPAQHRLRDQAAHWATPTTAEAGKIANRPNYGQQGLSKHPAIVGLPDREKMPKSREGTTSSNPDSHSIPLAQPMKPDGTTSSFIIPYSPQHIAGMDTPCSPKCRRLNPMFAEYLMGLPPGWVSLTPLDSSVTAWFQQLQLQLGLI